VLFVTKNERELLEKNKQLEAQIAQLLSENNNLKKEKEALQFTLQKLNRNIFGKKSEKTPQEKDHNLFNLNEAEDNQNLNLDEPSIEKVIRPKKKSSRKDNMQYLEEKEITYDLTHKCCEKCDTPLVSIGSKTRETIEVIKKVIKNLEKSLTYKCPSCDTFYNGEMPKLPIEKSIATPSLLSQVIVDKMANGIPLYRQSEDYKRIGANLSRQVLSNWMIKSSHLLEIIYHKMKDDLLSSDIIHADETVLQVLKESGKPASSKSYMWLFESSVHDKDIVLYHYDTSRSGTVPKEFLKDFKGYLHVDGYQGYNLVDNVQLVNCFAHLRRKFYDIVSSLSEDQKKSSHSVLALNKISDIYNLDNQCKELPLDKRLAFKQEIIKPLFNEFKEWLNEESLTAQGNYGSAVGYALKHIDSVMVYLEDARLEIDNNRAERAIKPFVIGRKNWLFSNTPNGAYSSSVLYSIVQTAILNEINPYKYIAHILHILANSKINELNLDELTPYNEKILKQFSMNNPQ
jgi:transposase